MINKHEPTYLGKLINKYANLFLVESQLRVSICLLYCSIYTNVRMVGKLSFRWRSKIKSKTYHETHDDLLLVLSLCFEAKFNETKLKEYDPNFNGTLYLRFLAGKYFKMRMSNIDYDDVSTNILEYWTSCMFKSINTTLNTTTSTHGWKTPYVTYSGFFESADILVNCYGLE